MLLQRPAKRGALFNLNEMFEMKENLIVGVLGGPLGVLLGGSMGMLIGGAVDANDMADNASLLEKAGVSLLNDETAIILLAQEEYETP